MNPQQRSIKDKDGVFSRELLKLEKGELVSIKKYIDADCNGDIWITIPEIVFSTILTKEQIIFINTFYSLDLKEGAILADIILDSFIIKEGKNITFKTGIYNKDSNGNYWRAKKTSDLEMAFYLSLFSSDYSNIKSKI
ncbi:MAG: hypothetical protein WC389_16055 [Lutibacter sp.]|jgi:hypothetical protein